MNCLRASHSFAVNEYVGQSVGTKLDLRSMPWSYGLDFGNRSAAFFSITFANGLQ